MIIEDFQAAVNTGSMHITSITCLFVPRTTS